VRMGCGTAGGKFMYVYVHGRREGELSYSCAM
jgi:hypothetical protein